MSVAMFLLAMAAAADPPTVPKAEPAKTGSRLESGVEHSSYGNHPDSDQAVYRFLECAATRRTSRVRAIIDARTPAEQMQSRTALDDIQRCNMDAYTSVYITGMQADNGTIRGMVAEVFLKRDGKGVMPDARALQRPYPRDWYDLTGRPRPLDEMAVCTAETNPGGIIALLATRLGSPQQRAAIGALGPSLGPCLAAGYQLKANALGLRTALAEALYHRMFDAPSDTSAAKGKL